MRVPELIDEFLAWCGRHRAPATGRFYKQRLQLFREKFSQRRFIPWHAGDAADGIRPLDIDGFLHDAGEGWSASTRRHNAVALESLQSFALDQKLIAVPIFGKLDKPAMGRRERVPTDAEIERLLAAGASPEFRLVFSALCQTGCRPGEICRLTVAHVVAPPAGDVGEAMTASQPHFVKVIEMAEHKTARKTGAPRRIPIGQKFAELLRQAIGRRTFGPVFRTLKGRPWTPSGLSAIFRRLRDKARLPKELVLYTTRHRFGTTLASRKLDIKSIADLMGHASVKTTERYIHRDVTELAGDQDLL
jgi:integrase